MHSPDIRRHGRIKLKTRVEDLREIDAVGSQRATTVVTCSSCGGCYASPPSSVYVFVYVVLFLSVRLCGFVCVFVYVVLFMCSFVVQRNLQLTFCS